MLENNSFDEVKTLIAKQPNIVNLLRNRFNYTLLMKAAFNERKDFFTFFATQPHDVSVVDDNGGLNVLHYIVLCNDDDVAIEMLRCLDTSQLNYNVINKQSNIYERTPLHCAARNNRHKAIQWLLKHRADPSIKDYRGLLPDEHDRCYEETRRIIRSYRKW